MEIAFISSAIQQPRHQKRIEALSKSFDVTLFYYTRALYTQNEYAFSGDMVNLGVVENRNYHKRLGAWHKLYSHLTRTPIAIAYCTSVEHALLALWAGKRVFLELGDLHQLGNLEWLWRNLDAYLLRRLAGLVLTSEFYESDYYRYVENYDSQRVLIVENRLPNVVRQFVDGYRVELQNTSEAASCRNRKKALGIIGNIRYPRILDRIAEVVKNRQKDIVLQVYGDGHHSVFDEIRGCNYHGPFENPKDLPEIYSNIDVNLILYDVFNPNVRLALPNKLYESVGFLKPIICSNGCRLGDIVQEKGIGCATDLEGLETAIDTVFENYEVYVRSLDALGPEFYLQDDHPLLTFVSERC